jgi:hypothetical protein
VRPEIPLPDWLEDRLAEQEADPTDIPAARAALEAAITWQLRYVALGLLANRLLQAGDRPGRTVWWHQYQLGRDGQCSFTPPPEDDDQFRAFRRDLKRQIVTRGLRRIDPAEAAGLRLRLLGGHVSLASEGLVNAQLTTLGSSCYYVAEPAYELRAAQAARLASAPAPALGKRLLFFFGEVQPATATGRIRLIRFTSERAVSPYENPASPVFYSRGRLVQRATALPDFLLMGHYGHEFGHVVQDLGDHPDHGLRSWRALIRLDLCRYLQVPATMADIGRTFFPAVVGPHGQLESPMAALLPGGSWFPPGEEDLPQQDPVPALLRELLADGLVQQRGDQYCCQLYQKGRRWLL